MTKIYDVPLICNPNRNGTEEESSIGSTLTVGLDEKKTACIELNRRKRVVSFDTAKNVEHSSPNIEDHDKISDSWYRNADFKKMKEKFIDLGRDFQDCEEGTNVEENQRFKDIVCKVFEACCSATTEVHSCPLDFEEEVEMQRLFQKEHRVGMERASALSIFADKSQRRKALRRAIFAVQAVLVDMDPIVRAEKICKVSSEISRPSRLFAWRIACAQSSDFP